MPTIIQQYMTNNDCYKANSKIKPRGVMIHSTATRGVMAAQWYARWNKPGVEKAVHAFVDNIDIIQYLPWNMRAWHCGASGNNTHIGIEMCEPRSEIWTDKTYFSAAYANMVWLTATLCIKYNISVTPTTVCSHVEGNALGIASNHADVAHWWKYTDANMDKFRTDVKEMIEGMKISRLAGENRYDTAAQYSRRQWPNGCKYAYLTTGINFPDGLMAGA